MPRLRLAGRQAPPAGTQHGHGSLPTVDGHNRRRRATGGRTVNDAMGYHDDQIAKSTMTPPPIVGLTLVEFIQRCLDEDQWVAEAATAGPWRYDPTMVHEVSREESVFAGAPGKAATTIA